MIVDGLADLQAVPPCSALVQCAQLDGRRCQPLCGYDQVLVQEAGGIPRVDKVDVILLGECINAGFRERSVTEWLVVWFWVWMV